MTTTDPHKANKLQRARACSQDNRLAEAHALYSEICKGGKIDAQVHYEFGVVCGKLRQFPAAETQFRQATTLHPEFVMAHCGLGAALKAQGRLVEAVACFRMATDLKPDFAEAHYDLGDLLSLLGQLEEARESFHSAIRHRPNLAPAHHRLGVVCYSLGQLEEAAGHLQRALELNPGLAESSIALGRVLTTLGRLDDARVACRRALNLKPGDPEAMTALISIHEWAGDLDAAQELLAPMVAQNVQHPEVALLFARLCRHDNRCNDAMEQIKRLLAQGTLSKTDERQLRYALGKLLDSVGNYEAAFSEYSAANAILPPPYNAEQHRRSVDALIAFFSDEAFVRLPRADHGFTQPVFIVGMPRSGTSLVEQILASHPQVFGAGEMTDIPRLVAHLPTALGTKRGYPSCLDLLSKASTNHLSREYLDRLVSLTGGARVVTDKLPHNFLHLGVIALLFPNARVIHCKRGALDTGLSIYFQYFNASHGYSHDLAQIGSHYREYERVMAHWERVLPLQILDVRYEELVTGPEANIRKLMEFCGLDWDERCLRFYKHQRFVNTASYDQVRQPLHPNSIGRWKHYEQFLGPLKAELARL